MVKGKSVVILSQNGKDTIHDAAEIAVPGVKIGVAGANNLIHLHLPINFVNSRISIRANDSYVEIGRTNRPVTLNIDIKNGDGQGVVIGDELSAGGATILMLDPRSEVRFGRDCMLSSDILIMSGDGHSIYDAVQPNVCKNWSEGVYFGDHVWIGRGVRVLAGSVISDGSILASGAMVKGKFEEPNVVIAGVVAKVKVRNIRWDRRAPNIMHEQKVKFYDANNLAIPESEMGARLSSEPDRRWAELQTKYRKDRRRRLMEKVEAGRRALDARPDDQSWLEHIATLLIEVGEWKDAEHVIDTAMQAGVVESGWSYVRKSEILAARGERSSALKFACRAADVSPARAEWLQWVVKLLLQDGQHDRALSYIPVNRDGLPTSDWGQKAVLEICAARKDWRRSALVLTHALLDRPSDQNLLRALATAYFNMGKLEATKEVALKSVSFRSHQMWAYLLLSRIHEMQQDIPQAIHWVQRALADQADHSGFQARLRKLATRAAAQQS